MKIWRIKPSDRRSLDRFVDVRHDPSELPITGGSAGPNTPGQIQAQDPRPSREQADSTPTTTHEKLNVVQEKLRRISFELNELSTRMFSDVNFSQQDMKRVQALQTAEMECRKAL